MMGASLSTLIFERQWTKKFEMFLWPNHCQAQIEMFVADEAYSLCTDSMKPYPSRHLAHGQLIYNYRFSRAIRIIENAFGILAN